RNVRLERDASAFEKNHLARPIVLGGIAIVRVVQRREIRGDADGIASHRDVLQHVRIPDAFLALAVRSVVIQVAELPQQRAFSDPWSADDRDAHTADYISTRTGGRR